MKNKKKLDFNKIWIYVFLTFMLSIPLIGVSKPLMVAFLIFSVILILCFKFNINKFPIFIFLFSFFTRLIIVLILKTPPESDFEILYNASLDILDKNYSFVNDFYFQTWSYQIGFAFIQSLFLKVWNSIMFLKIINCLVSAATTLLIYLIAKEFTDEKSSKITSIIYSLLPFTLTYTNILTNQYLSSLLIYLGIYILISKNIKLNNIKKYILVGVILAIANIIRPESIIPLFSIILFLILTMNKKNIKSNLVNIFAIVGAYFCTSLLITILFSLSGIAPNGLKNNDPYWKFVLGFNHETGGSYSDFDVQNLGNIEKEIEIIKERVFTSPIKIINLFYKKIQKFWLNTSLDWSFYHIHNGGFYLLGNYVYVGTIINMLEKTNNYIILIGYILLIIGLHKYITKTDYNKNIILLINQVFVTFGVYLLIEVQPRYSYHIIITVAILASLGIHEVIQYIENKKNMR